MTDFPPITVIMPIYNEAEFIVNSVGAIQKQDYPGELEILCVDGFSTDATRALVLQIGEADPRVKLLDNPGKVVPTAMNIGIQAARFDLIARMDGHALAAPDYLRQCVRVMQQTGADCVGGTWVYNCSSFKQCAIAAAMESQFAVGTAVWRGDQPGYADTVPYGFFNKALLEQVGGFDEAMTVNQDYELMVRIRQAGAQIYYSPTIKSEYFPRQSFRALVRQYFRYGQWKVRTLLKHPSSLKSRHLAAPGFVLGLIAGFPLRRLSNTLRLLYALALVAYTLLSAFFAMRQAQKWGKQYFLSAMFIFLLLHLAWGVGFWTGFVRWQLAAR